MKERESLKLKKKQQQTNKQTKNAENAKPRPMGHQQILSHRLALLATDSLELDLAQSFIKELTNTHEHTIFKKYDGHSHCRSIITRTTYPCSVYPLEPHFQYIEKLGFEGVSLFFLFLIQNIHCVYSLEPPRRGGSNEYPQSMFRARIRKIFKIV